MGTLMGMGISMGYGYGWPRSEHCSGSDEAGTVWTMAPEVIGRRGRSVAEEGNLTMIIMIIMIVMIRSVAEEAPKEQEPPDPNPGHLVNCFFFLYNILEFILHVSKLVIGSRGCSARKEGSEASPSFVIPSCFKAFIC